MSPRRYLLIINSGFVALGLFFYWYIEGIVMALLTGATPSSAEVSHLLKKHGVIATMQRVEIAQSLLDRRQHVSAEEVLHKVNKASNGRAVVSKATVYNTLKLFANKGLIREIFADPLKVYYEPTTNDHHHFFDVDTNTLLDIDPDKISLTRIPAPPAGSKVIGVDVIIRVASQSAS